MPEYHGVVSNMKFLSVFVDLQVLLHLNLSNGYLNVMVKKISEARACMG